MPDFPRRPSLDTSRTGGPRVDLPRPASTPPGGKASGVSTPQQPRRNSMEPSGALVLARAPSRGPVSQGRAPGSALAALGARRDAPQRPAIEDAPKRPAIEAPPKRLTIEAPPGKAAAEEAVEIEEIVRTHPPALAHPVHAAAGPDAAHAATGPRLLPLHQETIDHLGRMDATIPGFLASPQGRHFLDQLARGCPDCSPADKSNYEALGRLWGLLEEPPAPPHASVPDTLQGIADARRQMRAIGDGLPRSMADALNGRHHDTAARLAAMHAQFVQMRLALRAASPDELGRTSPGRIGEPAPPGQPAHPAQQVVDWATGTGELLARLQAFFGEDSQEARAAKSLHHEALLAARDTNVQVLANREGRAGFDAIAQPFVEALADATPQVRAAMLKPPRPSSTYRPDEA